jgi:hypothetical protein
MRPGGCRFQHQKKKTGELLTRWLHYPSIEWKWLMMVHLVFANSREEKKEGSGTTQKRT